jgi:hypothetical protein
MVTPQVSFGLKQLLKVAQFLQKPSQKDVVIT